MFKTIFLDLDDTILDFGAAERVAVSKTFREIGLEPTDALVRRYSEINQQQWECFERGAITRDTVLVRRFEVLFRELGLNEDAVAASAAVEDSYRGHLAEGHYFVEGAEDTLPISHRSTTCILLPTASRKHSTPVSPAQGSRRISAKFSAPRRPVTTSPNARILTTASHASRILTRLRR